VQLIAQFWSIPLMSVISLRRRIVAFALSAAVIASAAPGAWGSVDLLWDPPERTVGTGDLFTLHLQAVSNLPQGQSVSAMDVILSWDPAVIRLVRVIDDGPYAWLFSGFPNDSGLDGLNQTFADGDALYEALGRLGMPALVSTDGLLVCSFEFEALTPSTGTTLHILPSAGLFSHTRIYDGTIPGLQVQDELGSALIVVRTCAPPDGDDDGDVDLADFAGFQRCFAPGGSSDEGCLCSFDADSDNDIDLVDFAALAGALNGPTGP
jgi:hypothetical protein